MRSAFGPGQRRDLSGSNPESSATPRPLRTVVLIISQGLLSPSCGCGPGLLFP